MIVLSILSWSTSDAAQEEHFAGIFGAGVDLPSAIYNSPYCGFETKDPSNSAALRRVV